MDTSGRPDPRARLLQLSQAQDASLAELSRLIGRNASYLQQFVRRGSPRRLEERDRRILAEFFGVRESELGGEEISSTPDTNRPVAIPRLPLSAAAGGGRFVHDEAAYDELHFSPRFLREFGLDPRETVALAIEGDSMMPLLNPGDEILVDRARRSGEGVFVVRLDDTLLVKRLRLEGEGRARLVSDNPAYPPVAVALDDIAIIGRVVWKGGRV